MPRGVGISRRSPSGGPAAGEHDARTPAGRSTAEQDVPLFTVRLASAQCESAAGDVRAQFPFQARLDPGTGWRCVCVPPAYHRGMDSRLARAVVGDADLDDFDLDALVRVSDDSANRLLAALGVLKARYRVHAPALRPTREDILAGKHLFLMTDAGPLDVLGFIGKQQRYEDMRVHLQTCASMVPRSTSSASMN